MKSGVEKSMEPVYCVLVALHTIASHPTFTKRASGSKITLESDPDPAFYRMVGYRSFPAKIRKSAAI